MSRIELGVVAEQNLSFQFRIIEPQNSPNPGEGFRLGGVHTLDQSIGVGRGQDFTKKHPGKVHVPGVLGCAAGLFHAVHSGYTALSQKLEFFGNIPIANQRLVFHNF